MAPAWRAWLASAWCIHVFPPGKGCQGQDEVHRNPQSQIRLPAGPRASFHFGVKRGIFHSLYGPQERFEEGRRSQARVITSSCLDRIHGSKPSSFSPKGSAVVAAPDSRSLCVLKGIAKALPKFLALQWLKCYHFYSCNRDEVPGPSRSINLEIY